MQRNYTKIPAIPSPALEFYKPRYNFLGSQDISNYKLP